MQRRGSRGLLVCDEGADRRLVKFIRSSGWTVKEIPKSAKGIGLKDSALAEKYARGIYPILTTDHLAYQFNTKKGAVGYIQHQSVSPDEFGRYSLRITSFFSSHTAKDIRGRVWEIPTKGQPFIRKKIKK